MKKVLAVASTSWFSVGSVFVGLEMCRCQVYFSAT